jgi:dTDP-4-dehydrorhamnose 3,5-epimerase
MGSPAPSDIADVVVRPLKLLPNARGRLMEVQRNDEPDFPGFGQVYVTSTYPGVVKAWYRHHRQVDQIAPVRGGVKLVLYDARPESATLGVVQEIYVGELAPKLVRIPTGVWHGFQAVGTDEAFLLHLNAAPFNPAAPDEDRLPANDPSIPYRW